MVVFLNVLKGVNFVNVYGVILGKSGRHLNSSLHVFIRNKLFNPEKNCSVTKLDRPQEANP